MRGSHAGRALAALLAAASPAAAQTVSTWAEPIDTAAVRAIREEGFERSALAGLARHLTDVIGPRLTGSPAMREANRWTAETLRGFGLENAVVEPWGEFGRGWERVSCSGRILKPFVQPLAAQPSAWTGSTPGTVRGPAVLIDVEELEDLGEWEGRLAGAIVLARDPVETEPLFEAPASRRSLEDLLAAGEEAAAPADTAERRRRIEEWRRRRRLRAAVDSALAAEGAAAVLVPSSRAYGIVRGGGSWTGRDPAAPEPLPELVVAVEQYNQIHRNVTAGIPVEIELAVENRFHAADLRAYNTLADLPGTDLADEFVMIGGHLDSWHYGTGATDNAAGSVVMMEAMRILAALDRRPRRTIRIALWSGEEQGLLGSRAWVENHPELLPRISAYLNVDNGTGRIRGIMDQGNALAAPIFEELLWPFKDLGVVAVKHGDAGGTDHLAFDAAGVPGFNFIQDPIEYGTLTHHTAADTFERLLLDDLRQAAVVVAATAWHLANRDGMMPREP